MRDRLIELVKNAHDEQKYLTSDKSINAIADYLLEQGVIVPPCKVGDEVYVITYCRCGNVECYEQWQCHKKTTKRTPKSYYTAMEQQMGYKTFFNDIKVEKRYVSIGTICHKVLKKPFELKMIAELGKTVFTNKEDAVKALRGGDDK